MKSTQFLLSALCAASVGALAEEPAAAAEEEEAPVFPIVSSAKSFTVGGTIELSASYSKQGDEKDFDTNVDTVELDLGIEVNDNLAFNVALLYEEGEDLCFDVAEGVWTFDGELEGLSLHGGLVYMPFGRFETGLISDPLTLELGEISDGALGLAWESDYVDASVWCFAGDIKDAEDKGDEANFVAALTLKPCKGVEIWGAVITDVAEAAMDDDVSDAIDEGAEYDGAAGVNAGARVEIEGFTASAEYVAAVDDVRLGDDEFQPQAWAVDLAYALTERLTLAARYEGSKEFKPEEMPESQVGVGAEYAFESGVSLAAEYLYGRFEKDAEGKRPDDRHMVTGRVAFSF